MPKLSSLKTKINQLAFTSKSDEVKRLARLVEDLCGECEAIKRDVTRSRQEQEADSADFGPKTDEMAEPIITRAGKLTNADDRTSIGA